MSGPHSWHRGPAAGNGPVTMSHVCDETGCDFVPPADPTHTYQHLRADNDPNGNPQRLFVVYAFDEETGYWSTVEVQDEGYGNPPMGIPSLPPVNISKSDYHNRIRAARARGILKES